MACGILVPGPGIKPVLLAVEEWNLNHWTTGKSHECLLNEHFRGKLCFCFFFFPQRQVFKNINAKRQWCLFSFSDLCLPKINHSGPPLVISECRETVAPLLRGLHRHPVKTDSWLLCESLRLHFAVYKLWTKSSNLFFGWITFSPGIWDAFHWDHRKKKWRSRHYDTTLCKCRYFQPSE